MTALHWATRRGNLEAAMLLIKRWADINAKDIVFFNILKEYEKSLNINKIFQFLDWKDSTLYCFAMRYDRHC